MTAKIVAARCSLKLRKLAFFFQSEFRYIELTFKKYLTNIFRLKFYSIYECALNYKLKNPIYAIGEFA